MKAILFLGGRNADSRRKFIDATASAFANAAIEPQELNALYDAAKNGREIESVFANGLYRYKAENQKSVVIDYVPVPVAHNPIAALNELGLNHSTITHFYDEESGLWNAWCYLAEDNEYDGRASHPERNQAFARAIMRAVCSKLACEGDNDDEEEIEEGGDDE